MNYWQERQLEIRERQFAAVAGQYEKELAVKYQQAANRTIKDLTALYDKLLSSSGNNKVLVSDLYKYNRYFSIIKNINKQLKALGQQEIEITDAKLLDMYSKTSSSVGQSIEFNRDFNIRQARKILDSVWCNDGQHWSNRIWRNKAQLQIAIEDGLIDCIARGASRQDLIKTLMEKFDVGYKAADRIARTELSYVQNQAAFDKYKEAGIEEYEILSAKDSRLCSHCEELNGKRFRLDAAEVGVNYPPFHPNCRCCVLGVKTKQRGQTDV